MHVTFKNRDDYFFANLITLSPRVNELYSGANNNCVLEGQKVYSTSYVEKVDRSLSYLRKEIFFQLGTIWLSPIPLNSIDTEMSEYRCSFNPN